MKWNIIAKYISQECTEEEKQLIEARIQSDQVFAKLIKTLQSSTNLNELPSRPVDVEALWQEFKHITNTETNRATIRKIVPSNTEKSVRRQKRLHPYLRIAAMLILTISATFLISKGLKISSEKTSLAHQYETVNVKNAQRLNLSLTDGSQITADAGSELRYFTSYKDERHVYLKGEACFDVAHDAQRPFYVHAGNAIVRVVGTRFNVRSWEINPDVVVTVAAGKVMVSHMDSPQSGTTMLTRGEQSTLTAHGMLSQPVKVDAEKYFRWMQNEIYFENAKVKEVVAQMERWYGFQFEFEPSQILEQEITVHIRGTNINEVNQVISLVTVPRSFVMGE